MKRIITQIALYLIPIFAFSQTNLEIDNLINNLSWESITCDHSYYTFIVNYKDSTVQKLIKIAPSMANKLLESIEDNEKTVIIHIILTKIFEPNKKYDYLSMKYIYKDCNKLIGWHNIFNGLIWEYLDGNYSISLQEIEKIKNYWKNKINGKINTWENNIEDIFKSLEKSDSIKYPCYKIYENNSNQIKVKDLMELFDYNFYSDKFNDIITILGNDSTMSIYNDCYYVSYGMDGLSFRFDSNNKLTYFLINKNYQGEMPFGLKYTDTEKDVELKIGKPNKSNPFYEKKQVEYTKKKLSIDYDKNRQIIKFAISK